MLGKNLFANAQAYSTNSVWYVHNRMNSSRCAFTRWAACLPIYYAGSDDPSLHSSIHASTGPFHNMYAFHCKEAVQIFRTRFQYMEVWKSKYAHLHCIFTESFYKYARFSLKRKKKFQRSSANKGFLQYVKTWKLGNLKKTRQQDDQIVLEKKHTRSFPHTTLYYFAYLVVLFFPNWRKLKYGDLHHEILKY